MGILIFINLFYPGKVLILKICGPIQPHPNRARMQIHAVCNRSNAQILRTCDGLL